MLTPMLNKNTPKHTIWENRYDGTNSNFSKNLNLNFESDNFSEKKFEKKRAQKCKKPKSKAWY